MSKTVLFRYIVGALSLLCLCVACSHKESTPRTTAYLIAYPSTWENIQLEGAEQSVVGFASDLIYEIAKKAGIKTQLIMADQDSFPSLLDSGQIDGVITTEMSNPVNDEFYEFSNPFYVAGTVVIVPLNAKYVKPDDMKNVEIGYDRNDGLELALGVKTTWIFRPYDNITEAIDSMIAGKIDGVVLRFMKAKQFAKGLYHSNIKVLMPPLVKRDIRLATRKGKNHELMQLFNRGVENFIQSGEYQKLLEYWGIDSQIPLDAKEPIVN